MGLAWDRPFSFTRDFVDGLQPLLAGQAAHVVGDQLTTRAKLDIAAPNSTSPLQTPPSSSPPLAHACCDSPENESKARRLANVDLARSPPMCCRIWTQVQKLPVATGLELWHSSGYA
jgi:hypothetical protein